MTTSSVVSVPVSPAARWAGWQRVGAVVVLCAAAGLQTVSELLERWVDPSEGTGLEWIAAHPGLAGLKTTIDLLVAPLLVGTVVILAVLAVGGSPRFAWPGGVLGVVGMCGFASFIGAGEVAFYALVTGGVDPVAVDTAYGAAGGLPLIVLFGMFWGGAGIGLSLLLIGLWRARSVPRGAVAVAGVFLMVDFSPLADLVPFPVHALFLTAMAWIAVSVVRAARRGSVEGMVDAGH